VPGVRIKSLLKILLLAAFVGAAAYVFGFTDAGRSLTEHVQVFIETTDPVHARLLYVLLYIVGTVFLLPGALLSFVGAVLFGVWEGTLYTWIGATVGATLAFGLAKALGRDFVDQLLGGKLQALDRRLRERGFVSLLVIRLLPIFPFNGVNFGCGLTSIRTRDYVLATAIGIIPGTFIYQYLFAKLGRKVLDEGFALSDLADIDVLLPIGIFVLFLVITGCLAKALGGKAKDESPPELSR
jgi:uncharacterized membrane protein YdjX (TVP38/TMEM64 family)